MSRCVLITDAESRAAVATARGLHDAGFEVAAVASRGARPAPAHWSRAVQTRLVAPDPLACPGAFVDAIEYAVAQRPYVLLLPVSDAALLAISRNRERLAPHVRIALPSVEIVERSQDKLALTEAAARRGMRPLATIACDGPAAATTAAMTLGFPLVAKTARSIVDIDGVRRRITSRLIGDQGELGAAVAGLGDRFLLQQVARGRVLSFAGVFADSKLLAEAVSHYHRTWHPQAGNAAFSETIEASPLLREQVVALLSEIGWNGIFELELIGSDGGAWAPIDLNPRPYGSLALAIRAGANLPAVWCDAVLGSALEPVRARPGMFYRWEDADLRHGLWQLRHGHPSAAARTLRIHRHVVHPHFELSDPGPLAARVAFLGAGARRRGREARDRTRYSDRPPAQPRHADRRRGPRVRPLPGPVAIIGAGPYGLAAAAHLSSAGVATHVFGQPMEFWHRQMPAGMVLRSRRRSSHIADPGRRLTIDAFEQATGRRVHDPSPLLGEFIDYGLWFQRRAVPDVDTRRVSEIRREHGGFRLELAGGEVVDAARVVVAAGLAPFAHVPQPFRGLPRSVVSHVSDHRDLGRFNGQAVVVVGGGQSALECAALLREGGARVEVVARTASIRWLPDPSAPAPRQRIPVPPPPTDVGGRLTGWIAATPDLFRATPEAGRRWVADRCVRPAAAGRLRARTDDLTVSCERFATAVAPIDDGVRLILDDGSTRFADHVLLATGYAVDVTRYPFIPEALEAQIERRAGYPALGPGLESSVPGLHFLGAPAALSFGPIMRFVVGTHYAAPALTRCALGQRQRPLRFAF